MLVALASALSTISIVGHVGSKQNEALCQKLNQLPSNASIILVCNDDGFRIYFPNGGVRFGNIRRSHWLNSSQLLVATISEDRAATETAKLEMQVVNLAEGTIGTAPIPDWFWQVTPWRDGKRLVRIQGNNDKSPRVEFVDVQTDEVDLVYDTHTSERQWAKEDAHQRDSQASLWMGIGVSWVAKNVFLLTVEPFDRDDLPRSSFRALIALVNTDDHSVRVLSQRGQVFSSLEGAPLVWQDGWIDGPLYLLSPPYDDQPVQLAPTGPWKTDVALADTGKQVAWLQSLAPPGNWSKVLPITCTNCVGAGRPPDPLPTLQSIAIWDHATGQVNRLEVPEGTIWNFSSTNLWEQSSLHWSGDDEALLLATQAGEGSTEHTTLNRLDLNGKTILLSQHDWFGNLHVEWVGDDKSIYYNLTPRISKDTGYMEGPSKVWRLRPDGTREILPETERTGDWFVDPHGLLEALNRDDRGATVRDLNNGTVKHARFPQASSGEFELSFNTIEDLIPLSPDGKWAAFAGSLSDVIDEDTFRKDILIAAVK